MMKTAAEVEAERVEDMRVRLCCWMCWERLGSRVRMVDDVASPFAKCDLCGAANEDVELIEYEWV